MKLPVDEAIPRLLAGLNTSGAAVLCAPPGAGKSTRVPPALLAAGIAGDGMIVVLQPRRMAARAVAARMADERGERVGQTVGFRVRFQKKTSARTRILVVTEGVLTRWLLSDPFLDGVGCVVLDEFHERSVHADLAISFCRELMRVREDLKLVVMSATLETGPVATFLGGCPVIEAEGRPHPVRIDYLEAPGLRSLPRLAAAGVASLLSRDDDDGGDFLVFLPGAAAIERTRKALRTECEVVPLYGALPARAQDRALRPGPRRRVVLATNIAETSLTVPGVTAVVDSGLVKQVRHDPRTGLDRLEQVAASRHSADQRAGRAGRTAPGRVLRLWSEHEHRGRPLADRPEIQRVDPASWLCALLKFQPGDPRDFSFLDPPGDEALEAGIALLRRLGALTRKGFALTVRGERLANLPVHPRVGCRLQRAAERGLAREGALLAALIEERDLLEKPPGETTDSDLLDRAECFGRLEREGFSEPCARRLGMRPGAARAVRDARDQLIRLVARQNRDRRSSLSRDALLSLPLAGFPDRVCRRRRPGAPEAVMAGGRGVRLADDSGVREAELFLALEADAGQRGARATSLVRVASAVSREMLADEFARLISEEEDAVFDPGREAVIGIRRRYFDDLVLDEQEGVPVDPARVAAVLAEAAAQRFGRFFRPGRSAAQLRARVRFAAAHLPQEGFPDLSEAGIKAWLPELCRGKSRLGDLGRIDWAAEITKRLTGRQRRLLDREAPAHIRVPSGSQVRIDYEPALADEGAPVLAVRIQEMFGLDQTPRLARGRVPLCLHLLAPSGRPAQVTRDLASFWRDVYPQVRKELRGRYPKHAWPEDPLSARPHGPSGKKRS